MVSAYWRNSAILRYHLLFKALLDLYLIHHLVQPSGSRYAIQ